MVEVDICHPCKINKKHCQRQNGPRLLSLKLELPIFLSTWSQLQHSMQHHVADPFGDLIGYRPHLAFLLGSLIQVPYNSLLLVPYYHFLIETRKIGFSLGKNNDYCYWKDCDVFEKPVIISSYHHYNCLERTVVLWTPSLLSINIYVVCIVTKFIFYIYHVFDHFQTQNIKNERDKFCVFNKRPCFVFVGAKTCKLCEISLKMRCFCLNH